MKGVIHTLVWSLLQQLLLSHLSSQGSLGNGLTSLYTGQPINVNDTRGSCLADGVLYMSETAIPRDHPCHYCICYQSRVTCYWKQCAAPPVNCDVMEFQNVCNPSLYVCALPRVTQPEPLHHPGRLLGRTGFPRVKRKLIRKVKRRRISRGAAHPRRQGGTMPVQEGVTVTFEKAWSEYVHRRKRRSLPRSAESDEESQIGGGGGGSLGFADTSCTVFGVKYNLGEVIGVASDVCMECRCAAGVLFCSPKCCFLPSPFSLGEGQNGGHNSLFIQVPSSGEARPPHPLHYVTNQLDGNRFT